MTKYETYAVSMDRLGIRPEPYIYWRAMTASGVDMVTPAIKIITNNPPSECGVCSEETHLMKVCGRWCCRDCEPHLHTYYAESHKGNIGAAWLKLMAATGKPLRNPSVNRNTIMCKTVKNKPLPPSIANYPMSVKIV